MQKARRKKKNCRTYRQVVAGSGLELVPHGGQNVLYWHWSPEYGWEMNFPVHGYNECLIMYILAAASPTHGVPAAVYHEGWHKTEPSFHPTR